MSRIYFHSPSGDAELSGSERAWMSLLVRDIAEGLLDIHDHEDTDRLLALVSAGNHLHRLDRNSPGWLAPWANTFRRSWSGMFTEEDFTWRGRPLNTFCVNLNTALKVGSDPIKLAARLHAQCEINAWVGGPNRAWLAGIIEEGLEAGLFRRTLRYTSMDGTEAESPQGWDDVVALLRLRDDEPVVTSHSSGDQFPYPVGMDYDEWTELTAEQQWAAAIAELRADVESGLELTPSNWKTFNFRHGLSVFDINAADMGHRLDAALMAEVS